MNLELNTPYFFQSRWGCSFLRIIKPIPYKISNRMLVLSGIMLRELMSTPLFGSKEEYEDYFEKRNFGISVWSLEADYIKSQIIIPFDKLPSNRYRVLDKRNPSNPEVIPVGLDKVEVLIYERDLKLNKILEYEFG